LIEVIRGQVSTGIQQDNVIGGRIDGGGGMNNVVIAIVVDNRRRGGSGGLHINFGRRLNGTVSIWTSLPSTSRICRSVIPWSGWMVLSWKRLMLLLVLLVLLMVVMSLCH
jgi:hypothetical protein